MRRSKIG